MSQTSKQENFRNSIKLQQENPELEKAYSFIANQLHSLSDEYIAQNSFENKEYLCYLFSAIFLEYRRLYPDLTVYIPFRIKSDYSFGNNVNKETHKSFVSLPQSDFDTLQSHFSSDKITDDISAGTIVLNHIKNSGVRAYLDPEIDELFRKRDESTQYVSEIERTLEDGFVSEEDYFNIKKDLLERLIDFSFKEFTLDRSIPYKTELENLIRFYEDKDFSVSISSSQLANLKELIGDLRSKLSDKLKYEILIRTLPEVLNSPLLKVLSVESEFVKDVRKPNGFAAIYYRLKTPFGVVELQAQSEKRFFEAKKGSASHSEQNGKKIPIEKFFELSDPNDKYDLSYYLKRLDSVPVDSLISDIEIPYFNSESEKMDFLKTPDGERYLRSQKINELLTHIKLKDKIVLESSEYANEQVEDSTPLEISVDDYLFNFAVNVSPYMLVANDSHATYSSVAIPHKNLVSEFTEVIRKKDSITCLGDILIERLKKVVEQKRYTDENFFDLHRDSASLPQEITRSDILNYAERKLIPKEPEEK